jgi:hypothetical protein
MRIAALPALVARPEDEERHLHLTVQLALHDHPESHRLFLLIDQFEEIFTLCNDEAARRQLIDNVLYATSVIQGRTIVVLSMRADFYGQCASYPGLRAAISDYQSLIGPLSERELREVIETPAQLAGGELEPGLMELLLADMKGQAGALPFLGHALFKLWEKRDGRRLTAKAYTDTGRLQGALNAHAEEFFTKKLSTEEQHLCHQLLVDLVHPGEGAADTKERLLDSAREWQKNSKTEDFLYRGAQLAAAEEIFGLSGESLPRLGREFFEVSIAQRQRKHEERERQQKRELQAAQRAALAEPGRAAEAERRPGRASRRYLNRPLLVRVRIRRRDREFQSRGRLR